MAGAPGKTDGGAVYVIFGRANPASVNTTTLSSTGSDDGRGDPRRLADREPLRRLPAGLAHRHVAGCAPRRQRRRLQRPRRRRARRRPAHHRRRRRGRAVRQAPRRAHHAQRPVGEGLPVLLPHRLPVAPEPARRHDRRKRRRHDRRRPAGHRDRRAAGRLQRHRLGLGLDHQRPHRRRSSAAPSPAGGTLAPGSSARGSSSTASPPARATASTARLRATGWASSLAGIGDQNGDGIPDLAIGAASASPNGRAGSGEVVVVPGQADQTTRNLAVTPPLQTFYGPAAGAGLGASLVARRRHRRRRPLRGAGRGAGRGICRRRGVPGEHRARHDLRPRTGERQDRAGRGRRHDRQRRRGRLDRSTAAAPTRSSRRRAPTAATAPGTSSEARAPPSCRRRRPRPRRPRRRPRRRHRRLRPPSRRGAPP